MKTNFKKSEILAPCGNLENFNTAINAGANAVYLGLSDFNARMKADNFNKDNISKIVEKAHLLGTKVYLTLNTLIKTKEFPKLIEIVKSAINAKVDAFIIQDLGIAKLLKEVCPNAILHASTQLGVHNLYGAKMLESLGFSRVVLSREAKLEDIKQISQNTNLEIEYFVHGALCVSFSGNCYLSSFKFGESGNRGRCLQLCRLPYSATLKNKPQDGYLLSPADLCLIKNLKTLIQAGVTSFKIEGRLKRAGYVGRTVSAYKTAIENLEKNWDIDSEIQKLEVAFSRGKFNESAYLESGTPDNIINKTFNNHAGIKIGTVLSSKKFKDLFELTIRSSHKISAQDGLKFFEKEKEIGSMGVGNVIEKNKDTYSVFTKREIKANADVYLTLDHNSDTEVLSKIKKLDIVGNIQAKENLPLKLTLSYQETHAEITSNYVCPIARNKETENSEIYNQISKMGESEFNLKSLNIQKDFVFIPKSILNEVRRDCIQKLKENIIKTANSKILASFNEEKVSNFLNTEVNLKNSFKNIILFDNIGSLEQLKITEIIKDSLFAYCPKNHITAKKELSSIKEKFKNINLGLNLPIIANGKDLQLIDDLISNSKDLVLIANNLYGLYYIEKGYKVIAGTGLNTFNKFSAKLLEELGILGIVQSAELNKENLIENQNCFVYSLGFFPLMTFAHCPYKTLQNNNCKNCSYENNLEYSNNGLSHKIRKYKISNCYFELLNSSFINILSKHVYSKFLDLRELNNNDIEIVYTSLKNNSFKQITEKENFGLFLKEIK